MLLGAQLVAEGLCTSQDVEEALRAQAQFRGRLGSNLIELGLIEVDELATALGRQRNVPPALLHHFKMVTAQTLGKIPKRLAEKFGAVPIGVPPNSPRQLAVALVDPFAVGAMEELAFAAGARIIAMIAPENRIDEALAKFYGITRGDQHGFIRMRAPGRRRNPRPGSAIATPGPMPALGVDADGRLSMPPMRTVEPLDPEVPAPTQTTAISSAARPVRRRHLTPPPMPPGSFDFLQVGPAPQTEPALPPNPPPALAAVAASKRTPFAEPTDAAPIVAPLPPTPLDSSPLAQPSGPLTRPSSPPAQPVTTPRAFPPTSQPIAPSPAYVPSPSQPMCARAPGPVPQPITAVTRQPVPLPPPEPHSYVSRPFVVSDPPPNELMELPEATFSVPPQGAHLAYATAVSDPPTALDDDDLTEDDASTSDHGTLDLEGTTALAADEAVEELSRARTKEDVGAAICGFLRTWFHTGLVLIVKDGTALGWKGFSTSDRGEADAESIEAIALPLHAASIFRTALQDKKAVKSAPPDDGSALQGRLFKLLHCAAPADMIVAPIMIGGRVVNLVCAFSSDGSAIPRQAATEVEAIVKAANDAYVALIKSKTK